MDINQIKQLIRQGEGTQVEFKEAKDSIPNSFYETIVSFSNTDGGTILLGVSDDRKVTGVNPESVVDLKKNIITALNSPDCISPSIFVEPTTIEHPDGLILIIQVPQSSQVHNHGGTIYYREFESDIDISKKQEQLSNLYLRKKNFFTETMIYPYLAITDLEDSLFTKARNLVSIKSDHPWLSMSNEEILRSTSLWLKDYITGQEGLTLASALIFGKEKTIHNILPAYKVEAMVRIHDRDRWDDRITLRKNLIDTYLELKQFIDRYLPDKFYLEGDRRIDLRDVIFREVIGNAIVHREYTSAYSTDLIITDTEVVLTNPNKALFHGPIDPNSFSSFPKNPNIRKFFREFAWTDERGTGIRNTSKYLPLYVPNAKPTFIENDIFRTIIPLVCFTMEKHAAQFQQWLGLPDDCLHHLTKGLSNVSLSNESLTENWEDLLLHFISSWSKKDTKLEQLRWSFSKAFEKEKKKRIPSQDHKGTKLNIEKVSIDEDQIIESIKKVPSWNQKGTKLLSKRSLFLISIMALTLEPIKLQEMMGWMEYKNRKTLRELYLDPLMIIGFVARTIQDKPKDPKQQYILTESGKLFLAGI
jgi:ATP-dependent DNA helicase RecG